MNYRLGSLACKGLHSYLSLTNRERGCFRARGRQQKLVLLFLDISRDAIGAVIEIK